MENATTPPLTEKKKKGKGTEKPGIRGTAPVIAAPHDGFSHAIELLGKTPELREKIVTLALNEGHDFKGKTGAIRAAAKLPDTFEDIPSRYMTSKDLGNIKRLLDFIGLMTSVCKVQHEIFLILQRHQGDMGCPMP